VNVFLQYWAFEAFRADRIHKDHGVSPEAGPEGASTLARQDTVPETGVAPGAPRKLRPVRGQHTVHALTAGTDASSPLFRLSVAAAWAIVAILTTVRLAR
jgi:hypothetical protein